MTRHDPHLLRVRFLARQLRRPLSCVFVRLLARLKRSTQAMRARSALQLPQNASQIVSSNLFAAGTDGIRWTLGVVRCDRSILKTP